MAKMCDRIVARSGYDGAVVVSASELNIRNESLLMQVRDCPSCLH